MQRTNKRASPVSVALTESKRESAVHLEAKPSRREHGDARDLSFLGLGPESVDLVVTSPPYWRRRDYGHHDQIGQESTPEEYIQVLVKALNDWGDLLRPHGSVFLNIGDTYREGFLAGIPALFEMAARESGWNVVNQISWIKSIGMPEPRSYRLASRHESVYHLTRSKKPARVFFDLFALAQDVGQSANPGDVWMLSWSDDVWALHPTRSRTDHLAPFPPELARRAILLACPERVCTTCGRPYIRRLEATSDLDRSRQQAVRAMELAKQYGLTEEHFAAIRAVGISDAGKGQKLQNGAGRNSARVKELASYAKEKLGGYFREFTFAPKRQVGWAGCECGAPTTPGIVLDPFMGSGTTLLVAEALGRNAIGVDLIVSEELKPIN
jgi:DNA modification methylase